MVCIRDILDPDPKLFCFGSATLHLRRVLLLLASLLHFWWKLKYKRVRGEGNWYPITFCKNHRPLLCPGLKRKCISFKPRHPFSRKIMSCCMDPESPNRNRNFKRRGLNIVYTERWYCVKLQTSIWQPPVRSLFQHPLEESWQTLRNYKNGHQQIEMNECDNIRNTQVAINEINMSAYVPEVPVHLFWGPYPGVYSLRQPGEPCPSCPVSSSADLPRTSCSNRYI